MGRIEYDRQVEEDPEPEWVGRITYDDEDGVELTTGLPGNFSGKEENATRWILLRYEVADLFSLLYIYHR